MTIKQQIDNNKSLIIKIISGVVLFLAFIFISDYIAKRKVNLMETGFRNEFQLQNRALYDNLVRIQVQMEDLEKYHSQKVVIIKQEYEVQRVNLDDAIKNGKREVVAKSFDNLVDTLFYLDNDIRSR